MSINEMFSSEIKQMFHYSRLNRLRYIGYLGWFYLFIIILNGLYTVSYFSGYMSLMIVCGFLFFAVSLLGFFLELFWFVRRINDTGFSALWWLLSLFLGIIAFFVSMFLGSVFPNLSWVQMLCMILTIIGLIGMVLFVVIQIAMFFWPGTPGENRFGSVPSENNGFVISGVVLYILLFFASSILALLGFWSQG